MAVRPQKKKNQPKPPWEISNALKEKKRFSNGWLGTRSLRLSGMVLLTKRVRKFQFGLTDNSAEVSKRLYSELIGVPLATPFQIP